MTPLEARLWRVLIAQEGRVLSREALLDAVWGVDYDGRSTIVDAYIRRLRCKLDATAAAGIRTIRGVGYAFQRA